MSPAESQHREPAHRRCIVSGEVLPRQQLLRFVVAPDDCVVPDLAERLPGRGMWVRAEKELIAQACTRNVFAKAAGGRTTVADDLQDQIETRLRVRCIDIISLARRAGQMVGGYEKVRAALRTGKAGALLAASDGSPRSQQDLHRLAATVPVVRLFSAAELGSAIGRARIVHGAVSQGRLSQQLLREVNRLTGVLGLGSARITA